MYNGVQKERRQYVAAKSAPKGSKIRKQAASMLLKQKRRIGNKAQQIRGKQ